MLVDPDPASVRLPREDDRLTLVPLQLVAADRRAREHVVGEDRNLAE